MAVKAAPRKRVSRKVTPAPEPVAVAPHEAAIAAPPPPPPPVVDQSPRGIRVVYLPFQRGLFESMASLMMIGVGTVISVSPKSMQTDSFVVLGQFISPQMIAFLFISFGVMGLGAMVANGMWKGRGPALRIARAIVGLLVWGQIFYSLMVWSLIHEYISIFVPVCLMLTVGELFSCYRAAADGRSRHS